MARVTRRAAVFVEHATHSGPAQPAVCSLIMGRVGGAGDEAVCRAAGEVLPIATG